MGAQVLTSGAVGVVPYRVDAKRAGAVGDGVTDDRAALIATISAAKLFNATAYLPPDGKYRISKYLLIEHARGLTIDGGGGAQIIYPSDDVDLVSEGAGSVAPGNQHARAAMLPRYCSDLVIQGITFIGRTSGDLNVNLGPGVYARNTVNLTLRDCNQIYGSSLIIQDAVVDTTGTGDSLTVATGIVTIADSAAVFVAGHGAGSRRITITGASNEANNGTFPLTAYNSTSSLAFTNADGVTETSSFTWTIDDGDRITRIFGGYSYGARQSCRGAHDVVFDGHTFERPGEQDVVGVGDVFTVSGTTVTLSDHNYRISKRLIGKWITIAGATTSGNNGRFQITAVTLKALGGGTPATISYVNASGVPERFDPSSSQVPTYWVMCGEKTGVGSGTLVKVGTAMTMTSTTNAFTANDIGKTIRIRNATTDSSGKNNGRFLIAAVPAANQVTFTNEDAGAVQEAFSGQWSIDSYDRTHDADGSSHAIYIFAGRSNYKIVNCTFKNIRTVGVKVSGTASPITDVIVEGNTFYECGMAALFGADDPNEHINFIFANNNVVDCGTGRDGWNDNAAVAIYGSRNVRIIGNHFYYTRLAIAACDGTTFGNSNVGITVQRYLSKGQPVENVTIADNHFTVDPNCTFPNQKTLQTAISANEVGVRGYNGTVTGASTLIKTTTGTFVVTADATSDELTKTNHGWTTGYGPVWVSSTVTLPTNLAATTNYWVIKTGTNTFKLATSLANAQAGTAIDLGSAGSGVHTATDGTMQVTDANNDMTWQMVGHSVEIVNSTNGNDGTFVVSFAEDHSFTYTNLAGVTASVAGTYRIFPGRFITTPESNMAHMGGTLTITNNVFDNVAANAVLTTNCVATRITDNTLANCSIKVTGDVMPTIRRNREISGNTGSAHILISNVSWPIIGENYAVNPNAMSTTIASQDMTIGDAAGTVIDFPLLGMRGRARPSNALQEIVVAYGAGHVDGDTITVTGTTYTYKATSPSGNQFNSFASLIALIDAQANHDCADYGTGLSAGSIATNHLRIRKTTATTTDAGEINVRTRALKPTALVMLRNKVTSSSVCFGRGSGSAGPIADKTVIWSPCAHHTSVASLEADNDAARAILAGYAANGKITCSTVANLVDSDYMTIPDGIGIAKLYEFDKAGDGVTSGRVQVNVSTDTTAAQVAARLRTAILANQPALAVTDNADGTLTIAHNWNGAGGNVTITENVAHASFVVTGLSNGGIGGSRQLRNIDDTGCCAVVQHAKSSNQAGTDTVAEFRWSLAS